MEVALEAVHVCAAAIVVLAGYLVRNAVGEEDVDGAVEEIGYATLPDIAAIGLLRVS